MEEPRSSRLGRRGGATVSKKTPNGASRSAYADFFPATFPAGPEDYAEIFGGLATSCSIPVLDLPPEIDGGDDAPSGPWSSVFDYAEIFRGFDGGDFAVSYEELVAESKRPEKKTLSMNERTPNETVFNQQTTKFSDLPSEGSDGGHVACLERDQILSDSHSSNDESIDYDMPYQKTSQASMVDLVNGKAHVTQSYVFPGSMFVADACSLSQNIESDGCANKVNNDLSFNQHFNMGRTEGKQEKIFSYASSSGGAKGFENDVLEDQKHFAIGPLASEDDGPTNTSNHSDSSSYQSTSSGDISHPNYTFLTVSDISLQTQPLKMPPPSRPPPTADNKQGHLKTKKLANPKADLDEEKLYKKMIDHQTHHGGDACKNHVLQEAVKGNTSYFFDVEVDASSAAAASAAAMKEAMEQAQARLKSAKELMERKRDNFRSCKKFGNRHVNWKERKEYTAAEEFKSFSEGMTQETILRVDKEVNYVTINEKQQAPKAPMVTSELEGKETNKASTEKGRQTMDQKETASSRPSIRLEEKNAKRKVDKQFYKLKNDVKEFKMGHDGSEHEGFEKKPITAVQTNEDMVNERQVLQDFKTVQEVSEQVLFSNISQVLKKANGDREYESEVGKVVCEHKRNGNLHAVKESSELDKNINKHGARIMAVSEEELKETLNSKPDVSVQEQNNNELEVSSEVSVKQENENSLKEAPEFNQQGESEMKLEEEEKLHVCAEENKPNDAEEAFACKDDDEKSKAFVEACRTDGVYQCEGEDKKPLAGTLRDHGMEMNATFVTHEPDEGDNMKFGNKSGWQYENSREVGVPHGSCLCKVKEKMNASSEASQSEENEKTNIPASVSFAPGLNKYKLEGTNVTLQQETKKLNGIPESHELVSNENIMEVTPDDLDMEENEKKHEAALNNVVEDAKNEKELEAAKEACQQDYIVKKTREDPLERQQNGKKQRVVQVTHEVEKFESRLTVDKEEQGPQDIDHIKEDKASHAAKSNKGLNIAQEVLQGVEEKNPEAARQAILLEEKRNVTNRVLDFAETCVRTEHTAADTRKEDRREIMGKIDRKTEQGKELARKLEEEKEREREREKDRLAVERASHGAHERAFAESRERAERIAVERVTAEARQRALAEAREKAERASSEALEKSIAEKASREAKLRAERAAVERATAEAWERAAEKAAAEARERAERSRLKPTVCKQDIQDASNGTQRQSGSLNQVPSLNEKFGGVEGESALRCKARLERHQRTVERAAKALAEKNMRDILAQREQAERNRLAESLDAEVRRWSNGKEGNLRALLSTLQYILGPDSGWQPIPLTDVITAAAVKKAYKKAALYVHPDKLQQRGASIHQKYICEKVFDLLKDAWNRFNSEER